MGGVKMRARFTIGVVCVAAASVLGACGSSAKASRDGTSAIGTPSSTASTRSSTAGASTGDGGTTTTTFDPAGHVIPAPDTPTTVPREGQDPGLPVGKYVGTGQQILIKPGGAFWPAIIYAVYQVPVIWTNQSGRPQTVTFLGIPVKSGTIPPGAQWVLKFPSSGTVSYYSAYGTHGVIYFEAPAPPVTVPTSAAKK